MAKKDPAWKIQGLDGPPPVVRGYHHYEAWKAEDGPQRESLRHAWGIAIWSWKHWGKKVRRDIRIHRERKRAAQDSHPLG